MSSAVSGVPSWNLALSTMFSVQVSWSSDSVQLVASSGPERAVRVERDRLVVDQLVHPVRLFEQAVARVAEVREAGHADPDGATGGPGAVGVGWRIRDCRTSLQSKPAGRRRPARRLRRRGLASAGRGRWSLGRRMACAEGDAVGGAGAPHAITSNPTISGVTRRTLSQTSRHKSISFLLGARTRGASARMAQPAVCG